MNHLASMHKPILAVVGKNDPRVPWSESLDAEVMFIRQNLLAEK